MVSPKTNPMKKPLSLLIAFLFFTFAYCQKEEQKIKDAVVALDNALVKKDSLTLKQLISDDFIGVIPSGKYFNKADYIKNHCKPNVGLMSLNAKSGAQDLVRIYENTAIVNRTVVAQLKKPDGSVSEFDVQRIEALRKKDGKWILVSGQGTEVNLALRP